MQPYAVADADDAVGDVAPGFGVVGVIALPDAFHFEIQEEALYHRVYPSSCPYGSCCRPGRAWSAAPDARRWRTGRIQLVVAKPSFMEAFMGRPAGWMKKLTGRAVLRSRGAPSHRREVARQVWQQIATGITSERAAEAVGESQPVGTRWFRHRGGMPLFMST